MMTLKKIYLGLVLFFMYAPILLLVVFSFNYSTRNAWGGFSLRHYQALLNSRDIMRALRITLLVAILSTVISVVIGTLAAISVDKLGKRKKSVIMAVSKLPVMMPDIVTGLTLMALFGFAFRMVGFGGLGFNTLLLAHVIFNIPYVMLSVLPRLRQLDQNLYEAALDLGCKPFMAFLRVVLPQLWPGIITGAMLAFTLSVDDFMVSFFTSSPTTENLSMLIFSMARRGVDPRINAMSTIIFLTIMVMLFLINKRDQHLIKKQGDEQ